MSYSPWKKLPSLYKDYKISVESSSLLGGHYIAIEPGSKTAGAADTAALKGSQPADLLGEATKVVRDIKSSLDNGEIMKKVENVLKNLEVSTNDFKEITAQIKSGEGTLGRLIYKDDVIPELKKYLQPMEDAGKSIAKAGDKVGEAADELKKFGSGLNEIVAEARDGKGLLGKLMTDESVWNDLQEAGKNIKTFTANLNDPNGSINKLLADDGKLYKDLEDIMKNVREVSEKINSGEGTLGKLINDEQAYNDLKAVLNDGRKALQEVQHAVQDFREQAPISTFGGIIFGAL